MLQAGKGELGILKIRTCCFNTELSAVVLHDTGLTSMGMLIMC